MKLADAPAQSLRGPRLATPSPAARTARARRAAHDRAGPSIAPLMLVSHALCPYV
ncbi:MAG: hypothetical protein OEY03_11185 [Rhizobacter sp.]|nr:hypothetical protein [Rhizobacter sp.]